MRARLIAPVEQVVGELNASSAANSWAGFFRYGNSAWVFDKIRRYAVMRSRCSSPSGTSAAGHGFRKGVPVSGQRRPGLSHGIVVAPRPNRP